jgi:phospholipase/carboxylesterase
MAVPTLPLVHRVRRPRREDGPPLLVLMHGYGSNEDDLFALAPYLDERLLVVCPRAPIVLMPGSYAWFEIGFYQDARGRTQIAVDERQARMSHEVVAEFIAAAVRAYGADPARVIVGGFSQGASMAAMTALVRPDLVAGALVLSGIVPSQIMEDAPPAEQLAGKAFFVGHGMHDQVVQIEHGRATRELLQALPVELTYHEYPGMGHEINAECLRDVTAWLRERL